MGAVEGQDTYAPRGFTYRQNDMVTVRLLPVQKRSETDAVEVREQLYEDVACSGYNPHFAAVATPNQDEFEVLPVSVTGEAEGGLGLPEESIETVLDGEYVFGERRVEEPVTADGIGTRRTMEEYFEADRPYVFLGFVSDDVPPELGWSVL